MNELMYVQYVCMTEGMKKREELTRCFSLNRSYGRNAEWKSDESVNFSWGEEKGKTFKRHENTRVERGLSFFHLPVCLV